MALRKNTRVEEYRIIHTWTDDEIGFKAEVRKEDWVWLVTAGRENKSVSLYAGAVDLVMDSWRLVKSGRRSWEESAAEMAADAGLSWWELSGNEQQDYLDSARLMGRMGL